MLSNLELTGYFLEVKNRKTTSARRQTTATEAALLLFSRNYIAQETQCRHLKFPAKT